MTGKPTHAVGYRRDHVELARTACLHIATILGDMAGDIVVVGGLVPSLIVDQGNLPEGAEPHAGTMDLDLGLALAVLDGERYQTLAERLRSAGFSPDRNSQGHMVLQRWLLMVVAKARMHTTSFMSCETSATGRVMWLAGWSHLCLPLKRRLHWIFCGAISRTSTRWGQPGSRPS